MNANEDLFHAKTGKKYKGYKGKSAFQNDFQSKWTIWAHAWKQLASVFNAFFADYIICFHTNTLKKAIFGGNCFQETHKVIEFIQLYKNNINIIIQSNS